MTVGEPPGTTSDSYYPYVEVLGYIKYSRKFKLNFVNVTLRPKIASIIFGFKRNLLKFRPSKDFF